MSLAINPEKIAAVLLADGWHDVDAGSVDCDAFEIHWPGDTSYIAQPKAESTGITWTETRLGPDGNFQRVEHFAPLNYVLAIRYYAIERDAL